MHPTKMEVQETKRGGRFRTRHSGENGEIGEQVQGDW